MTLEIAFFANMLSVAFGILSLTIGILTLKRITKLDERKLQALLFLKIKKIKFVMKVLFIGILFLASASFFHLQFHIDSYLIYHMLSDIFRLVGFAAIFIAINCFYSCMKPYA